MMGVEEAGAVLFAPFPYFVLSYRTVFSIVFIFLVSTFTGPTCNRQWQSAT